MITYQSTLQYNLALMQHIYFTAFDRVLSTENSFFEEGGFVNTHYKFLFFCLCDLHRIAMGIASIRIIVIVVVIIRSCFYLQ